MTDATTYSGGRMINPVAIIKKALPELLLFFSVLLLYAPILDSFWLVDDPQIMKHVFSHSIWEDFLSPAAWQEYMNWNYFPWLTSSYAIDVSLFGLQQFGFYLHHLMSLAFMPVALYWVLRLWCSKSLSLWGALVFAVSPAFSDVSRFLMVRHYVEGMIFALLSVYFFVKADRGIRKGYFAIAAFFYLMACFSKEIYVPLVFIFPLIAEGDIRHKIRVSLPLVFICILYIPWRRFMMGQFVGGYGIELSWSDGLMFFPRLAGTMGSGLKSGIWFWALLLAVGLIGGVASLFIFNRKIFYAALGTFPLVVLPVLPVSTIMVGRYVLVPTCYWIALQVIALETILKVKNRFVWRLGSWLWCLLLLGTFLYAGHANFIRLDDDVRRAGKEGHFVLYEGSADDLLIGMFSPEWYFEGLFWLRANVLSLPTGPSVMIGTKTYPAAMDQHQGYKKVWMYDEGKDAVTIKFMLR